MQEHEKAEMLGWWLTNVSIGPFEGFSLQEVLHCGTLWCLTLIQPSAYKQDMTKHIALLFYNGSTDKKFVWY